MSKREELRRRADAALRDVLGPRSAERRRLLKSRGPRELYELAAQFQHGASLASDHWSRSASARVAQVAEALADEALEERPHAEP